ncbi:IS66 family insertion sequence element accessory protein TnpB [Candidatus Saccharibacteria bacterium]|nr:IS66 family insertion sequence element accessory protein TnpB [Candidatus Saccharibacteria bacterium]
MLAIGAATRIFLFRETIDMRKGFESLSGLVESAFTGELTTGAYFVFLNWKRDRLKVLYWDIDGLAIWYKRLEKGSYPKRHNDDVIIERKDFLMLLEGVTPKRIQKRFRIS